MKQEIVKIGALPCQAWIKIVGVKKGNYADEALARKVPFSVQFREAVAI